MLLSLLQQNSAFWRPFCTRMESCKVDPGANAATRESVRARRYWTLVEAEPRAWQVPEQALPSDARERADLVALARGDLKAAQACTFPAPPPCPLSESDIHMRLREPFPRERLEVVITPSHSAWSRA